MTAAPLIPGAAARAFHEIQARLADVRTLERAARDAYHAALCGPDPVAVSAARERAGFKPDLQPEPCPRWAARGRDRAPTSFRDRGNEASACEAERPDNRGYLHSVRTGLDWMTQPHHETFTPVLGEDGKPDFEVSLTTLCTWADCSDETVLKHAREGVIRRYGKGRYRLREALQARARFLADDRRHATKSAADSRVQDARAMEIELRIAREERELIPLADTIGLLDEYATAVVTAVKNIPTRASRDPTERARLQPFIDEALHVVADQMQARAQELRTGDAPPAPSRAVRRAARRAAR